MAKVLEAKPQPDESRLLSREEIKKIRAIADRICNDIAQSTEGHFKHEDLEAVFEDADMEIAKAQLAKDMEHEQARVKRIFEEIIDLGVMTYQRRSTWELWQALKKREGL